MRPENTLLLMASNIPAVISKGAVSPTIRAIATTTEVTKPAAEVRSTIETTVRHLGTPKA